MSSLSNPLPPYADNPIGSVEQSILNHAANFPVFGQRMRRSAESPLRPQGVEIVSGTRITQWEYDQQRGWLKQKIYPDANTGNPGANKITYTYTGAGRWRHKGTDNLRMFGILNGCTSISCQS